MKANLGTLETRRRTQGSVKNHDLDPAGIPLVSNSDCDDA